LSEAAAAAGQPSRVPGFLSAFAFRSFRLLWIGAFLSSIGTWTQDVALSWLIHTRIGDPFYLGLRTFAAELPLIAFMLVGGAVADRVDRRRILLSSQLFQMSMAMALGILFFLDRLGIAAILIIAFLTGLAQSQSAPTYQATLTSLVPPDKIPNAVALNSLQFNLSRAIGPVIAGLLFLYGWELFAYVPGYLPRFTLTAYLRSLLSHRPAEEGLAQAFGPVVLGTGESLLSLAVLTVALLVLAFGIFSRREYVMEQ
jgi:MFS family permease